MKKMKNLQSEDLKIQIHEKLIQTTPPSLVLPSMILLDNLEKVLNFFQNHLSPSIFSMFQTCQKHEKTTPNTFFRLQNLKILDVWIIEANTKTKCNGQEKSTQHLFFLNQVYFPNFLVHLSKLQSRQNLSKIHSMGLKNSELIGTSKSRLFFSKLIHIPLQIFYPGQLYFSMPYLLRDLSKFHCLFRDNTLSLSTFFKYLYQRCLALYIRVLIQLRQQRSSPPYGS